MFILDCLTTQVLKVSGIKFESAVLRNEEELPEMIENDSEIILEKVEEEQNAMPSDDDSDSGGTLLNMSYNRKKTFDQGFNGEQENNVDTENNWRLEMERVLPQLKVVIRADPRHTDWRAHLEQIKMLHKEIEGVRQ